MFMSIMAVVMLGGAMLPQWMKGGDQSMPPFLLCIWLIMMPPLSVGQSWLQQWRFLECESLKPLRRADFLKEIGVAIAIELFQAWAVFATAYVVLARLLSPVDASNLATVVVGSFATQILMLGVLIWSLRHRSPGRFMLATCAAFVAPALAIGLVTLPPFEHYRSSAVALTVLLAAVGVLIGRAGCRRWLDTELG
jgi:hypothetical protein